MDEEWIPDKKDILGQLANSGLLSRLYGMGEGS
jgi:hypothetical protein